MADELLDDNAGLLVAALSRASTENRGREGADFGGSFATRRPDRAEAELDAYLADHGIAELLAVFRLLAAWKDEDRREGNRGKKDA